VKFPGPLNTLVRFAFFSRLTSVVKFVLFSATCAIVCVGFAAAVCVWAKATLDAPTIERITKAATIAEKSFLLIIFTSKIDLILVLIYDFTYAINFAFSLLATCITK
jgi:hypothetical protein